MGWGVWGVDCTSLTVRKWLLGCMAFRRAFALHMGGFGFFGRGLDGGVVDGWMDGWGVGKEGGGRCMGYYKA